MIRFIPIYAETSNGIRHISDIPPGQTKTCRCPKCGLPLIARRGEFSPLRFIHRQRNPDCHFRNESYLHFLAKKIIFSRGKIYLPDSSGDANPIRLRQITMEKSFGPYNIDVHGLDENGRDIILEICYQHPVAEDKRKFYREMNVSAIEIDIGAAYGLRDLENHVLRDAPRRWLWRSRGFQESKSAVLQRSIPESKTEPLEDSLFSRDELRFALLELADKFGPLDQTWFHGTMIKRPKRMSKHLAGIPFVIYCENLPEAYSRLAVLPATLIDNMSEHLNAEVQFKLSPGPDEFIYDRKTRQAIYFLRVTEWKLEE